MNVLIVGFGGMGCRHAQSLLGREGYKFYVVEPNHEVFTTNVKRINSDIRIFTHYQSLSEVAVPIDYAIVASSSQPRFQIVKDLIEKGIKKFLIEKVVFQSPEQFEIIIALCKRNNVKTFCNVANRYYKNYIDIKNYIHNSNVSKINIDIIAGDFGLASSCIHYFDLFEYFTGSKIKVIANSLFISDKPNRRGNEYKELNGFIKAEGQNNSNHSFSIVSLPGFQGGVVVKITLDSEQCVLFESNAKEVAFLNTGIKEKEFVIIPSSILTALVTDDIFNERCLFPSISDIYNAHAEIFKIFNPAFGLSQSPKTICPIT